MKNKILDKFAVVMLSILGSVVVTGLVYLVFCLLSMIFSCLMSTLSMTFVWILVFACLAVGLYRLLNE